MKDLEMFNNSSRFTKSHPLLIATIICCAMIALSTLTTKAHETKPRPATLSINGKGIVSAEPDIAFISSSVITEAKSAEDALSQNTAKMQAVFKALADAGIERKHIQTSNFSVQPRYVYHNPKKGQEQRPPRIVGYVVNNTLTAKVVELAKTGKVLSEVVKVGSNQLGNISFDISNKKELLDLARAEAVADAKRKAEIYLNAADVKLGKILSFSEGAAHSPRPRGKILARAALAEDAAVPVSGGERELSINVSITWEIIQ